MENKPDVSGVATFDKTKLKAVETQEKNTLPTKESKCAWFENRSANLRERLVNNLALFLPFSLSDFSAIEQEKKQ